MEFKKEKCSYADRYMGIYEPKCGCRTCYLKWKEALKHLREKASDCIPREWLQKKVDPSEVDCLEYIDKKFKPAREEEDELWFFSNGQEAFDQLAGREGYALVYKGRIIAAVCTLLS